MDVRRVATRISRGWLGLGVLLTALALTMSAFGAVVLPRLATSEAEPAGAPVVLIKADQPAEQDCPERTGDVADQI